MEFKAHAPFQKNAYFIPFIKLVQKWVIMMKIKKTFKTILRQIWPKLYLDIFDVSGTLSVKLI
uniref:Uncharacterized protein n=1 Tax=mine drainage metagenome TaxID=410659 RepID=E6QUR3_9ZZZZ